MSVNMAGYIGKGLSPQDFITGMTRNQDAFTSWYHQFTWPSVESRQFFGGLSETATGLHCIIIGADWCGDVVRNVPVVLRLMEEAAIPVEILVLEEHLELVDTHFFDDGRAFYSDCAICAGKRRDRRKVGAATQLYTRSHGGF
ncbi:hypothetical protein Heshes_13050 [Alicyclobacillus hesperidum]|uniref:Thioredoxin n=1 Tax=Alicyclobacillus hesperidum TaxID=89784 RepID=A0AA37TXF2_9BACL|nr:hypothetical protein Heshes_13050 [Alicyclobacillus hesperidum]